MRDHVEVDPMNRLFGRREEYAPNDISEWSDEESLEVQTPKGILEGKGSESISGCIRRS